jgi:hypothetical protein
MDGAIRDFILTKVQEVDEIRATILAYKSLLSLRKDEVKRQENAALILERRIDMMEQVVIECLNHLGEKKVESLVGSIRRQVNGGNQAVEITDEAMIPYEFFRMQGNISYEAWLELKRDATSYQESELDKMKRVPDLAAIRNAIEQDGGVPGARLRDRGEHLRIS